MTDTSRCSPTAGLPRSRRGAAEAAAQQAAVALDYFRQQQWPVLHVQHIATRPGASFFLPETEGAT